MIWRQRFSPILVKIMIDGKTDIGNGPGARGALKACLGKFRQRKILDTDLGIVDNITTVIQDKGRFCGIRINQKAQKDQ